MNYKFKTIAFLVVGMFATGFYPANTFAQTGASPSKYEQVKKFMTDLAAQYPQNATIVDIGPSDSGDRVIGLKVGNGPNKTLVVATHHGNEYGSTEVAKAFAASIAAQPLKDQTTFVVPVLNISGYNRNTREETKKGTTFDPNRDYPGPCGGDGPWNLQSTKGLADFLEKEQIISTLTLHTYSPVVAYPWGFSTQDTKTEYEDLYIKLAQAAVIASHYPIGNSAETIYPADGCYEDYVFWHSGIWSLLFEIGDTHSPSDTEVEQLIRDNVPGMRNVLEQMPTQRAPNHDFKGKCDGRSRFLDRREE